MLDLGGAALHGVELGKDFRRLARDRIGDVGEHALALFDRGVLRIPATRWRERNLKRLLRSLLKLRGERSREDVEKDYARLRRAYDLAWNRGV